jgi:hypothetical protein
VLTLTLNPIEAEKVLEDLETDDRSSYASKLMFLYFVAVADEDKRLQDLINLGDSEDVEMLWRAWKRTRNTEVSDAKEQPASQA